jgi:cytidylate kinase
MAIASNSVHSPAIDRLIERQIRNWELARAQRLDVPKKARPEVEDFITISRQAGVGGTEIAAALAGRLDWPRFDRELLKAMAGDDSMRERMYVSMDERDVGWLENTCRGLAGKGCDETTYFWRLTRTVLALARQGRGIYLGRGIDLMLPRHYGLRVRLVAPLNWRAARFAERHSMPCDQARREVRRVDLDRAEFVHNHFDSEIDDPLKYDLTLNVERYSQDEVVQLILAARPWPTESGGNAG